MEQNYTKTTNHAMTDALRETAIRPIDVSLYLPPINWKGDCVGHIGTNDTFFWVLEGECFLFIDEEAFLVRAGQLAFLPKGKKRMYTHASSAFSMYEMAFSATSDGVDLMGLLKLRDGDYAVDISDREEMSRLFEQAHRKELSKDLIHHLEWSANLLTIIHRYADARQRATASDVRFFAPVLHRLSEAVDRAVTTEELAGLLYMQPTYFIRRFKSTFGMPPQAYFHQLKLSRAMHFLVATDLPLDQVAKKIGMDDASYFARFFKKNCHCTPSEYRNAFKKPM